MHNNMSLSRLISRQIFSRLQMTRPQPFQIASYAQPEELQYPGQSEQHVRKAVPTKPSSLSVLIPRPPSIDELISPNLAAQAISNQAMESFSGWLLCHFHLTYCSFAARVQTNWMDFLRNIPGSTLPLALSWAIRALITFQMGTDQGKNESESESAIYCARHMYGRGVRHLRQLLQSPRALSDEALAAAVLLGGYEILDPSSPHGWIRHTRGVRQLMCARGPASHKSGFGRTLLLCFGPFLVAESFVLREHCFLGCPEWTFLADGGMYTSSTDEEDPRVGEIHLDIGYGLGQAMDKALSQAAICPGYYASTCSILAATTDIGSDPGLLARQDLLLARMAKSKACFLEAQTVFDRILGSSQNPNQPSSALVPRSISTVQACKLASWSCRGIASAVAVLDQLTSLLLSNKQRTSMQKANGINVRDPWRIFPQRIGMEVDGQDYSQRGPSQSMPAVPSTPTVVGDRLDRFSLTMGVLSVAGVSPNQL